MRMRDKLAPAKDLVELFLVSPLNSDAMSNISRLLKALRNDFLL